MCVALEIFVTEFTNVNFLFRYFTVEGGENV